MDTDDDEHRPPVPTKKPKALSPLSSFSLLLSSTTTTATSYMLVSDERLAQLSVAPFMKAYLDDKPVIPSLFLLSRCFHVHLTWSTAIVDGRQHPRSRVPLDLLSREHALETALFGGQFVNDALQDLVHRGAIVTTDLSDLLQLSSVFTFWPTVLVDLVVDYCHASLADELIALAEEHKQHLRSLPSDATIERFSPLYHRALAASKVGGVTSYVYHQSPDFTDCPDEMVQCAYDRTHRHTCHHAGVVVDEDEDLCAVLGRNNTDDIHTFPNVEVLILVSDQANVTSPILAFSTICQRCPRLRLIEWTIHVSDWDDDNDSGATSFYRRAYCSDFTDPQNAKFKYYN